MILGFTFNRGWSLGDAASLANQDAVSFHMKLGMLASILCCCSHALLLTYFMGTGRWLEETCRAYALGPEFRTENMQLKWRAYPAMTVCFVMLIMVMICGAAADRASVVDFQGFAGLTAGQVHLTSVLLTLTVNLSVNVWEFFAIRRNGVLVNAVLARVREIRTERGLEV